LLISNISCLETEKQLLEEIALIIQGIDASQIPTPEQIAVQQQPVPTPVGTPATPTSAAKGRASKQGPKTAQPSAQQTILNLKRMRTRVPTPPTPFPPLTKRYTQFTPLTESGVLVDTVKVALKQSKINDAGAGAGSQGQIGAGPGAGAAGKGKKKIIRVRS
jgi:signal recognition particle subunit SRP19